MAKPYAIARRIDPAALHFAADAAYVPLAPGPRAEVWLAGWGHTMACPLGIALYAAGYPASPLLSAQAVTLLLAPDANPASAEGEAIFNEACVFMYDWDNGRVDDLAAAFGLTGED